MKSLILTRVETTAEVKTLVNKSNILKIAVNRAEYKAHIRVFHDAHHWQSYLDYPEFLVTRVLNSVTDCVMTEEVPKELHNRFCFYADSERFQINKLLMIGCSLTPAIDLAIKLGSKEILLIADGDVGTSGFVPEIFIPEMNRAFKKLRKHANIYMFQKGFYDLPVMNIREFYEL